MDVIKSDSATFKRTRTRLPFGRTDALPDLSVLLFCNPASPIGRNSLPLIKNRPELSAMLSGTSPFNSCVRRISMADNNVPANPKNQPSARGLFVIFVIFLVWGYYYLFSLRPIFNQWIFRYVNSYPAILHLFPILAVPVVIAVVWDRITKIR